MTAAKAEELVNFQQDVLKEIRNVFNNAPDIMVAIRKAIEENDELRKQAEDYLREKVEIVKDQLIKNMVDRSGVKLIRFNAIIMPEIVKDVAFRIRAQVTDHLLFVAGTTEPSSGKLLKKFKEEEEDNLILLRQEGKMRMELLLLLIK